MRIEDVFTVHGRTMIVGYPRADEHFSFGPVQVRNPNGITHKGRIDRVEDLASSRTILSPDGRYGFVVSGLAAAHISVGGELLPGAIASDVVVGEGGSIASAAGRPSTPPPAPAPEPEPASEPAEPADAFPDALDLEAFAQRLAADLEAEVAKQEQQEQEQEDGDASEVEPDSEPPVEHGVVGEPDPGEGVAGDVADSGDLGPAPVDAPGVADAGSDAVGALALDGGGLPLVGGGEDAPALDGEPDGGPASTGGESPEPQVAAESVAEEAFAMPPGVVGVVIDAASEVVSAAPPALSEAEEEARAREEDPSAIGAQKRAAARRARRKSK